MSSFLCTRRLTSARSVTVCVCVATKGLLPPWPSATWRPIKVVPGWRDWRRPDGSGGRGVITADCNYRERPNETDKRGRASNIWVCPEKNFPELLVPSWKFQEQIKQETTPKWPFHKQRESDSGPIGFGPSPTPTTRTFVLIPSKFFQDLLNWCNFQDVMIQLPLRWDQFVSSFLHFHIFISEFFHA